MAAASSPSLVAGARLTLARSTTSDAPVFLTLAGGLGRLIQALVGAIGAGRVLLGSAVVALRRRAGGYELVTAGAAGRSSQADAVLLTAPGQRSSELLSGVDAEAAAVLAGTEYASVVLVSFALPVAAVARPLDGSGFLVPRSAGLLMTACSWSSSKWAHLGGDGTVRLRVSAGRDGDERIGGLDDGALVTALRRDLCTTMGITAHPSEVRVTRWPASLPQYRPGHLARLGALEASLAETSPGVMATGAAFRGVGLPACVHQGREAARRLVEHFG
jgi:oxygen-dependent protoporphyrinogen oxidase